MKPEFVHLHLHSQYSLLDGAIRIPDLMTAAREDGQRAIAITDHGNMFAAVPLYEEAKKQGIKPIIGCEIYVAKGSRHDRIPTSAGGKGYNHLVLLASNLAGYRNLVKIVSTGFTEGFYYKPRVDLEILAAHADGIIALSGCLNGVITEPLLKNRDDQAFELVGRYQDIYGKENFFLELQDHGMDEDSRVLSGLSDLSKRTGAPLVATNDCHYMQQSDSVAHDVLLCIQTGKGMGDPTRWKFANDQFYFKSQQAMATLFRDFPDAIKNTVEIAERIDFELGMGENFLPRFEVPNQQSVEAYFREVVYAGLAARRPTLDEMAAKGQLRRPIAEYTERLETELGIIERMEFPSYFLIVWDFIRYAREIGVPVGPGRGSAAGSLVAYCLRITDIDPLQYNLLFERFLNPERISMPDIDIDFCMRGRGKVIEYVTEKYGRESVAQIITFGTMAARAAIRDVGRALELGYGECDRIAKLIPAALEMTIAKALETVPALVEACQADPRIQRAIDLAQRLEGLTRHASVHAAGVVIAPGPVTDFCPLFKTNRDELVTQYAKDEIEKIGLLKMDFLGLRTLTVIADCVESLHRVEGIELDMEKLELTDLETYRLFSDGRTNGVFQFESAGMKDILRRLKPDRFEDLIALNALYRPGPMTMIDDYIQRRHGKVEWKVELPQIESILNETYGVIVYQEQVMQIASAMAGFSLGEADILRKAMGKKKADVMAAMRQKFLAGTQERKISQPKAKKIFDTMERFASYAFNKSHSAAYALLAYQTAYLKAHHPAHFMAAVLTSEKDNTPNVVKYIGECRDMGLDVQPPDVNESEVVFSVSGSKTIRFGLAAIKNVGEGAIETLIQSRGRNGRFDRLDGLCDDLDLRAVNKRVLESLIKAGALDSLGADRARLVAGLDRAFDVAQRAQADRLAGQASLFDEPVGVPANGDSGLPDVLPWTEKERLGFEKEALGFYITGHPLREFVDLLSGATNTDTLALSEEGAPSDARLGGIVVAVRTAKTKKGNYMAYVTLEDLNGVVEVIVFPELYQSVMPLLESGRVLLVRGKAEVDEQSARIIASEITPIEHVQMRAATRVVVRLATPPSRDSIVDELYQLFLRNRGDVPVTFEVTDGTNFTATLSPHSAFHVNSSPRLVDEIQAMLGHDAVKLEHMSDTP